MEPNKKAKFGQGNNAPVLAKNKSKIFPLQTVNAQNAEQALWLVKVPRYVHEAFQSNQAEVAMLEFQKPTPGSNLPNFKLKLNQKVLKGLKDPIPATYDVKTRLVEGQSLFYYGQDEPEMATSVKNLHTPAMNIHGHISHRLDVRPVMNDDYMQIKKHQIGKALVPKRVCKPMPTSASARYLPGTSHQKAVTVTVDPIKKKETYVRGDAETVRKMLFAAFERFDYYNFADLQSITKQPSQFLKEILVEICDYCTKYPHKFTWCLKEDYKQAK